MPKSSIRTRRRLALGGVGATTAIAAAALSMAPQAQAADFILKLNHTGTITTHLKTLNQDVVFNTTEQTAANLSNATVTSTITPSPGHADLVAPAWLGSLKLAAFDIKIIPSGPATGTLDLSDEATTNLSLTQKLSVQITKVTALGIPLNLVPNTCKTSETSLPLAGTLSKTDGSPDPLGSVHLTGTLTIPNFKNCGLVTPLINAIATGAGNTVTIDLGAGTTAS